MKRARWLVVGAGPAGLSAAWRLLSSGEKDVLVLERNRWPGGLSASFLDRKGFTWDLGGHVIHSHYPEYDRLLAELIPAQEWLQHRREAWIYYPEGWVPYPFQLHLDHLPPQRRERCLEGLRQAGKGSPPPAVMPQSRDGVGPLCERAGKAPLNRSGLQRDQERVQGTPRTTEALPPVSDFLSWMRSRFGEGIADIFMEPYNRKVWRTDPGRMGIYWLDDRVALPPAAGPAPVQWGPNATFRFPRRGGTGAICRKLAARVGRERVRYGCEVVRVDTDKRVATARDGRSFGYDALLSTMPLDRLAAACRPGIREKKGMQGRLVATPVAVIGLGLRGPRPEEIDHVTWMYFPQPETRIYRLTYFSRYSPANVPPRDGLWSLMLELSDLPARIDLPRLTNKAEEDIRRYKLISPKTAVVSRWARHLPYGYPVPTRDRETVRPGLLAELEGRQIFSRGRFGAWMYEVGNMDHSAMQGIEWAERMLTGAAETTINNPRGVNSPSGRQSPPAFGHSS